MIVYCIGHYAIGHEKPDGKLDIEEYRRVVFDQDALIWVEDCDVKTRKRSIEKHGKLPRLSCYGFHNIDGSYEVSLSFNSYGGGIYCELWDTNSERAYALMINVAKLLQCNVYKMGKVVYRFSRDIS